MNDGSEGIVNTEEKKDEKNSHMSFESVEHNHLTSVWKELNSASASS